MKKVLILNGSPQGQHGNCHYVTQKIDSYLSDLASETVVLSDVKNYKSLLKKIEKANGLIFVTGTYWDSWGSPLQRLLEEWTELEGSAAVLGKPAAVVVLMHSVGGKGVLSRLQGVLSTMGFFIPPMGGMVYSMVSDLALKGEKSPYHDDLWSLDDLQVVLSNFIKSLNLSVSWATWPVDRKSFKKTWLK